jgi:hypothetical protein
VADFVAAPTTRARFTFDVRIRRAGGRGPILETPQRSYHHDVLDIGQTGLP